MDYMLSSYFKQARSHKSRVQVINPVSLNPVSISDDLIVCWTVIVVELSFHMD